ncbi:flagellar biosynthesis/type III secretory pathway M-ring protein FliF/YscJ [Mucilaginibacter terrae]|uniref:Flagellar biosynthesis/type III secretory pathway M-ring protein FliF/YscJ n=1 Tax=Mucilaginibacter terrae TaxID=1955052 RepID=A0ABU3GVH8_9SPHI|nr:flagellar biosynthesis/type III secretory pathway M-ring protein FliF/YscJ [Mucilaginibacter terrae]
MNAKQSASLPSANTAEEERDRYLNTLPPAQRVSTWSTGTLWSIIILFAVLLIILIVGAIIMFA